MQFFPLFICIDVPPSKSLLIWISTSKRSLPFCIRPYERALRRGQFKETSDDRVKFSQIAYGHP